MRIGDIAANDSTNGAVPWYQAILNTLTQGAQAYITVDQQKQLNAINLQRAQQGLSPLDASRYQTGFNVGLGSSTQNTVLIGVGILAGVYLLSSLAGGSRRR